MKVDFYKYQGTGNDFIMIDDLHRDFDSDNKALIQRLCHRKFGIGSDGILLLQASDSSDFHVDFINPDGSRSFCGNGSRCAVQFAKDIGVIQDACRFTAIDGLHEALISNDKVELKMTDVPQVTLLKESVFMDTGSPHHIEFVSDAKKTDVRKEGRAIRYNDHYKADGVNVNFVERQGDKLYVRTYERGVEDETLSCGTGVTAAALASALSTDKTLVDIHTLGGDLSVRFKKTNTGFEDIWLIGPAKKVFEGSINL